MNAICPNNGKIQYESQEDAEDAIPRLQKKYGAVGTPYYCMYCGKWHLGKRKSKKKRRKGT